MPEKIETIEKRQVLNFDIPFDLYEKIKKEADRLGITMAGFARMQLIKYFEVKKEE